MGDRRRPRNRPRLAHRQPHRAPHERERQTLDRQVRISGREGDGPRLQRIDHHVRHRDNLWYRIDLRDKDGEGIGRTERRRPVVGHPHHHRVGAWALRLGRSKCHSTRRAHRQAHWTRHQREGQALHRQIDIARRQGEGQTARLGHLLIRHAGDHRRRIRREGHHDPEGVRHLHHPVAHRHLHPVRRRGLCGRRGPRHRAVLSHRETRRPLHPCEHQTLHRHIRILGRQPDRPRLQRFDCRIGHRRDRRSHIHLADHHRKLALDRLGSVVDRHPDGVRRRPLGLRRQPSQLALAGYRQTDRTAEESEGQRLDGQIRIRGGERALEQLQLVHRKGRIARPHRRLIDLAHPDLEQVGDRDLTVADGHQERMDLGTLGFGRSPSNLARGAHRQARRSRDQPVGQCLDRFIGIARGHLPPCCQSLGPLRRLGIEPYRRLIVLDHVHLEGHPTADLTVRRLGHDRPAGAAERFAGLPGPPAAGRHGESRGSAHQRPSQRSLQVGIRRSQRRTGGPVLHHAGIREGNHHRIDPRGGHGDHSAALHVRHSVAQLHAEGIVSGDVRSTRRPLQQAAGRQGDPGRCLQ